MSEKITKFYTYYGQKEMLPLIKEQSDRGVKTVIIDDCSLEPLQPIEGIDCYRIEQDIKWNMSGAKNLAFHLYDGWIMHSAMDNLLYASAMLELEKMEREIGEVYFVQVIIDGVLEPMNKNPHDTFIMHKSDFDKIGGFDEDFAGYWGYEDILFYQMCLKNFRVFDVQGVFVIHNDNGVCNMEKNADRNYPIFLQKLELNKITSPKLRFTWKKIE
jgi:hypothetical protein